MNFVNGIPVDGHQLVDSVYEFNSVGHTVPPGPHFNAERVCFYTGMQCEELGEKILAIANGAVESGERLHLLELANLLKSSGLDFKSGKHQGAVLRADREQLLDGAIDSAVVALGSAMYQTPHFRGAIGAVLLANANKCPGGVAKHDANGKIVKPVGWTKPDLAPFISHHGQE